MVSTTANVLTTIILTVLASATLLVTYRYAVRPMLLRHNIIPLQHLPSTISQHLSNRRSRGHIRLPSEDFDDDPREWNDDREGRLSRDLEDGFGVYIDDEEVGAGVEAEAEAEGVLQSPKGAEQVEGLLL